VIIVSVVMADKNVLAFGHKEPAEIPALLHRSESREEK
jgi:hypothetical protein